MRKYWSFLLVCLFATLFIACGSPDEGKELFTFDPAPVATTVDGTPIGYDPADCALYAPDQLHLILDVDALDDFKAWANEIGFVVLSEDISPAAGDAALIMAVPFGSVPDAVRAVRSQEGVIAADRVSFGVFPPEVTPTPAIACTPARG